MNFINFILIFLLIYYLGLCSLIPTYFVFCFLFIFSVLSFLCLFSRLSSHLFECIFIILKNYFNLYIVLFSVFVLDTLVVALSTLYIPTLSPSTGINILPVWVKCRNLTSLYILFPFTIYNCLIYLSTYIENQGDCYKLLLNCWI